MQLVYSSSTPFDARVHGATPRNPQLVAAKVDNVHCGTIYIPAYFISVGLLQGDSFQKSKDNLMTEWSITYLSCTGFWIPFMWANWRHCAPAQRVKAMAAGNLVWNVVIDHLAHRGAKDHAE
eukprot:Skav218649  [mRNA]  locus=scaffold365:667850:669880:- [translate_table: standard]